MAMVSDILASRSSEVFSARRGDTTLDAARQMKLRRIGCLLVLGEGRVLGILTERDILRRVVAENRDPKATLVQDVMSTDVACVQPDTTLDECRVVMTKRGIHYLPVVDSTRTLCGIVSITDVNAHDAGAQEVTIHSLQEYLYGATR
jgi:CBS domain-containing protein